MIFIALCMNKLYFSKANICWFEILEKKIKSLKLAKNVINSKCLDSLLKPS